MANRTHPPTVDAGFTAHRGRRAMRFAEPAYRVWPKIVRQDGGCWRWSASTDPGGYGMVQVDKVTHKAHRYVYELLVGPIPEDLHLDHLCRNRSCVNPSHLEPVTCAENIKRGDGHGSESHCPQGHAYTETNTYRFTPTDGYERRSCRACNREKQRRRKVA